jgi:hypothetical protein
VVEHSIGNGEVDSSILSGSTSFSQFKSIVCDHAKRSTWVQMQNDAAGRIDCVTFLTRKTCFVLAVHLPGAANRTGAMRRVLVGLRLAAELQ